MCTAAKFAMTCITASASSVPGSRVNSAAHVYGAQQAPAAAAAAAAAAHARGRAVVRHAVGGALAAAGLRRGELARALLEALTLDWVVLFDDPRDALKVGGVLHE